ncbi:MAG TPA: hypothetical protein VMB21_14235 [Candidatus Limnocylindria bacterium]|jgi:hypothetical protein|nr:hypothetical protein [Candidatus Limnocylindria bacterium]
MTLTEFKRRAKGRRVLVFIHEMIPVYITLAEAVKALCCAKENSVRIRAHTSPSTGNVWIGGVEGEEVVL